MLVLLPLLLLLLCTHNPMVRVVAVRLRLQLLTDMGMVACSVASLTPPAPDYLSVTLDGKLVGYLPSCVADQVVRR